MMDINLSFNLHCNISGIYSIKITIRAFDFSTFILYMMLRGRSVLGNPISKSTQEKKIHNAMPLWIQEGVNGHLSHNHTLETRHVSLFSSYFKVSIDDGDG